VLCALFEISLNLVITLVNVYDVKYQMKHIIFCHSFAKLLKILISYNL